jgi:hypothetical protein
MSTKLLIYETAVPVSVSKHRHHSVETGITYAFSSEMNSVPLVTAEFPAAAREYPIVFVQVGEAVIPAIVLGMRGKENLFLDEAGAWQAKYIPAFIRSYPFIFGSTDHGKTIVLCIDEAFAGLNQEGRGQRMFSDDGKQTPYLDKVLKLLQTYQVEFRRSQLFCQKLKERELLEPMWAQVGMPSGGRFSMAGFMAVDRKKLKALPADVLGEMAKSGELELIYLHLQSIYNFYGVRDRMAEAQVAKQGSAAEPPVAQEETAPAAGG